MNKKEMQSGYADDEIQTQIAHPPETIEGWYALHQIYRSTSPEDAHGKLSSPAAEEPPSGRGWTRWVRLIGSPPDLLLVHFRPPLDALATPQVASRHWIKTLGLELEYSFLSVIEAGLYHITAQLASNAEDRG